MSRDAHVQRWIVGIIAILVSIVVFLVPFVFIVLTGGRRPRRRPRASTSRWPTEWTSVAEPRRTCCRPRDYIVIAAFINSTILTVASVAIMVVFAAMVGVTCCSAQDAGGTRSINFFVLAGLIVPPAVVPTIWVLQGLGSSRRCRA